ncbi:MAG: METTL5 family protein [Halobacteria archaeon]|nr:METTL5 family protein [Halobacteria archaeon]
MVTDRSSLEIALEEVGGFEEPSPSLEQYATPADLASHVLHFAYMQGDIEGKQVVDLGCGTGVLSVGAALLGGDVLGVDIDTAAVGRARQNAATVGVSDLTDWVNADVGDLCLRLEDVTVVMNPPFGAQRRGADRPFLEKATEIGDVIYSIHNEGSRDFVEGFLGDRGEITHGFAAKLRVPHQFEFHTEESREIDVEAYRIE